MPVCYHGFAVQNMTWLVWWCKKSCGKNLFTFFVILICWAFVNNVIVNEHCDLANNVLCFNIMLLCTCETELTPG